MATENFLKGSSFLNHPWARAGFRRPCFYDYDPSLQYLPKAVGLPWLNSMQTEMTSLNNLISAYITVASNLSIPPPPYKVDLFSQYLCTTFSYKIFNFSRKTAILSSILMFGKFYFQKLLQFCASVPTILSMIVAIGKIIIVKYHRNRLLWPPRDATPATVVLSHWVFTRLASLNQRVYESTPFILINLV